MALALLVVLGAAPAAAAASPDIVKGGVTYWSVWDRTGCQGTEEEHTDCEDMRDCEHCKEINCEFDAWQDWSVGDCTGICERQRAIKTRNNKCGEPCQGALVETKNEGKCHLCPVEKKQDCAWSPWSDWSSCSCPCGGGQKQRDRGIAVAPVVGGKLCENKTRTEVAPCHTQSCKGDCVDARWQQWSDWSQCTASCEGGVRVRSRNIAQQASDCGEPVIGNGTEVEMCNPGPCEKGTPCKLGDWGDWSACSCTCDGVKRRSRRIEHYGTGNGAFCIDSTKEIEPCNIHTNLPECNRHQTVVNCEIGDWKEWSSCSASCGGGQTNRIRHVITESSGGGNPCNDTLQETNGCATDQCLINGTKPTNCKWSEWGDWGACEKCGGQMRRFRHIEAMPQFGGKPCGKEDDAEQVTNCTRKCHEKMLCTWDDWGSFGECSVTCGNHGSRKRERKLKPVPAADVEGKFAEAEVSIEHLNTQGRFSRLASAFVTGFVTLSIGMASLRLFRGSSARNVPMAADEEPLQGALEW